MLPLFSSLLYLSLYSSLSSAPVLSPWCQRLHSSGPFESHPRGGLDLEGMARGVRTRKGERETACYGRDGPFVRSCSKRARKGEGREAFRAWNIHETESLDKRNTSLSLSLLRAPDIPVSFGVGATESNREGQDRLS